MSTIKKILLGAAAVVVLGLGGFLVSEHVSDPGQGRSTDPEAIVSDYKDLLAEAEQLKALAGENCDNKKDVNRRIEEMEKKLSDLAARKKAWLDNVPKLPDINPETIVPENPLGRPGSEIPELSSDAPPLPDIDMDSIIVEERPGSQAPELTSDAPPLPDINEADIIDPDEYFYQMGELERKIGDLLRELKALCKDEEKKKVISDKCSDACQRYKDCAAYTEDVTPEDLNDAYDTCMEECPTWPKEMIKCINAIDIKIPNDCVSFLNCQVPQFYEETYLK
ncbi:hypothetical protein A2468_00010 [Candidatus Falkowbacteria bacterium RIFOXYC2_FULL_46_15]|nr:MAG: hypothetical protein A2468_00010 [Candidatus Falkowbacteria bacterium RIFOXYC2_FULL_46_15]